MSQQSTTLVHMTVEHHINTYDSVARHILTHDSVEHHFNTYVSAEQHINAHDCRTSH
jgi:hypothetical protein